MPAIDDLSLLTEATKQAGVIASEYFHGSARAWDKSDGTGPVTEADLAVDTYLRETLLAARPDHGWLSEETEDSTDRLDAEAVFIVDPIDGTRAFIEKSRDWAISVAMVRKGAVSAAVVLLPERNALYAAALGAGATLNGAPIRASETASFADAKVLATKPNMQPQFWGGPPPDFKRSFRSSLAYRLCLVAEGRYDAMFAFRPTWEWDIAAGSLIVTEASGSATDGNGTLLAFNNQHPQVAGILAGGALHNDIASRVAKTLPEPSSFTLPR